MSLTFWKSNSICSSLNIKPDGIFSFKISLASFMSSSFSTATAVEVKSILSFSVSASSPTLWDNSSSFLSGTIEPSTKNWPSFILLTISSLALSFNSVSNSCSNVFWSLSETAFISRLLPPESGDAFLPSISLDE